MDFDELKRVLEMVREHDLAELELERPDLKIRVRTNASGQWHATAPAIVLPQVPVVAPAAADAPASPAAPAEDVDWAVLKSPIVGTFYRSPEPGAALFTDVGSRVKKGQVLCIIEAMKLMNEITSEVDGEVVKVYVENGQAVQYGERLFAVRPS
ncbi:MAG: acetyl-CoA carboxylase biotin carboxyl carrier protein [Vicinamibacterales bacterium]|nr:acetyl-CoA carboxylase biotin carboxyl carrier protein [Vicinamibacterales bacterium]